MKKIIPIVLWLGMILLVAAIVATFFLQLKANSSLKKEIAEKKGDWQDAQKASRKLEDLEKKGFELRKNEAKLTRRVPVGEKEPLGLLKLITAQATKEGLHNIKFELKEASVVTLAPKHRAPATAPKPLYFQMKFQATFLQVVSFIKEMMDLERIVEIEQIEIDRKKEANPYQEIVMDMATYTFPE